ncbi:MAG TPA: DUF5063 domain-containing protein [Paludibacteraceae bacterium]|nr:DUF5063 domain-containing protein [Paludibacteraceae bacterium]
MTEQKFIYSKNVIEFVTVAAETCLFLENSADFGKIEFVAKATKILPLLYLKTTMVDISGLDNDEGIEHFVTEEDYIFVKEQVAELLGPDDSFLEVFDPNMPFSDTPIAAFISENLADIYQELKDFAANYQIGEDEIMETSLQTCIEAFAEHWGQKLLNALRALHSLQYSDTFGTDEDNTDLDPDDYRKLDRDSFLRFQTED